MYSIFHNYLLFPPISSEFSPISSKYKSFKSFQISSETSPSWFSFAISSITSSTVLSPVVVLSSYVLVIVPSSDTVEESTLGSSKDVPISLPSCSNLSIIS